MDITTKEQVEIDFWKNSIEENPTKFSVPNIINKFKEADIFIEKIVNYSNHFKTANNILEIGGGQGWASCMLKHYYPEKHITCSDISPYAIQSIPNWEHIFKVKIDDSFSCKSYQVPLKSDSVDLIFCFAAAHHFVKHKKTLQELSRILTKGGKILYLHEPVCLSYIYPLAKRRVNNKRDVVPEDLILYKKIAKLSADTNLDLKVMFSPTTKNRSFFGSFYYKILKQSIFLQKIFPCTADLLFIKK